MPVIKTEFQLHRVSRRSHVEYQMISTQYFAMYSTKHVTSLKFWYTNRCSFHENRFNTEKVDFPFQFTWQPDGASVILLFSNCDVHFSEELSLVVGESKLSF